MPYRDLSNVPHNCEDCIHNGKQWFDEPCDSCCPAHSGYEPITQDLRSEWRVSSNPIGGGGFVYSVYRIRNTSIVDHSGNRETYDCYDTVEEAEKKAAELNAAEGR